MSIILYDDTEPYAVHVHIYDENIEMFKELVQRATNLWPDAPAEIKEFADLVTNGRIMQDYRAQSATKKE